MVSTILLGVLTSAIGTFLGNLVLLQYLGKVIERADRDKLKKVQDLRQKIQEEMTERVRKAREYVKMES